MLLRFSRAIASLLACLFDMIVVELFNDFTQIESEETAESAQETLESLISLLGWELATEKRRGRALTRNSQP